MKRHLFNPVHNNIPTCLQLVSMDHPTIPKPWIRTSRTILWILTFSVVDLTGFTPQMAMPSEKG